MMLNEENEDFSDPILASLYKQSLTIDEDSDFQNAISKREFHQEEICGWTVNQCDFYRFKWNLQRKLLKTPNKDTKNVNANPRKSVSRQSVHRNDIDFDFKHYQHRVNYIEQYRNEKIKRQDPGITDILSKSSKKAEVCEQRTNQRTSTCEKSDIPKLEHPEIASAVRDGTTGSLHLQTKPLCSSGLFQGKKLYARPVFRHGSLYGNRETNWKEIINSSTASCKQSPPSRGMEESWTIVGVEKRPLPQRKKRTDLYSALSSKSHRTNLSSTTRYQKYSTATNKCDVWVKNREQELGGPYGCESFRVTPRSNSAPNTIYSNTRHALGKNPDEPRKAHTSLTENKSRSSQSQTSCSKMDYSCYTEMFKNVLEYYGTKKLKPKPKLPATNTENGRLLSVKT